MGGNINHVLAIKCEKHWVYHNKLYICELQPKSVPQIIRFLSACHWAYFIQSLNIETSDIFFSELKKPFCLPYSSNQNDFILPTLRYCRYAWHISKITTIITLFVFFLTIFKKTPAFNSQYHWSHYRFKCPCWQSLLGLAR